MFWYIEHIFSFFWAVFSQSVRERQIFAKLLENCYTDDLERVSVLLPVQGVQRAICNVRQSLGALYIIVALRFFWVLGEAEIAVKRRYSCETQRCLRKKAFLAFFFGQHQTECSCKEICLYMRLMYRKFSIHGLHV